MPSIDPTAASAAAQQAGAGAAATSLGQLDGDAFLKLLVAQMKYQDPMSPSDGSEMMRQTAQFTQVQTMQQLVSVQQQLMGLQQTAIGSELIGRRITATTETGAEIAGVLDGLRFTDEGPLLQVGEHEVPLDQARTVEQAT